MDKNNSERFLSLLKKAVESKNGNRVRHLVRIVANAYSNKEKELSNYFDNANKLVAGIATSAYHLLTKEIKPIQNIEYGGLGAIISESKSGLKFNRNQLGFAKLSGYSLWSSENSEYSLWSSENSGYSLRGSENSGDSLWSSKNSGDSLLSSKNSGDSLWSSKNSGYSLRGSENSGNSLWSSENSGDSLRDSKRNNNL